MGAIIRRDRIQLYKSAQAVWWVVAASLASATIEERQLRLVDDRGLPLASGVEVCFQIELKTDCRNVPAGQGTVWPVEFTSLRVEGPAHGPIRFSNIEGRLTSGLEPIRVPRKGTLQVRAGDVDRLSVALYPVADELFRTPLFRSSVATEPIRVPAGDFVAAVYAPGFAPDLHLVSVSPASAKQIRHNARGGWSLVTRSVTTAGRGVRKASVELSPEEGYALESPGQSASSDRHGLALFSGLQHPIARARVLHADFLPQEAHGLSSATGTFAFHSIVMRKGGVARVTIRRDNAPVAGIQCQVIRHTTPRQGPAVTKILFSGDSDRAGLCEFPRLEAGPYLLRLLVDRSRVDRKLLIEDDQETALEVSLQPLAITGKISRGGKPAAGFNVDVYDDNAVIPNRTPGDASAVATSDDEGEYKAELWAAGDYLVALRSPGGSPTAARRVALRGGDETVDFQLQDREIRGKVVDEQGAPLEQAAVTLIWSRARSGSYRRAISDELGRFDFSLEDEPGHAALTAGKEGYKALEPLAVDLAADAVPAPIVLRLEKNRTLRGFVRTAEGRGVAGGWLVAVATTGAVGAIQSRGNTGVAGDFELTRSQEAVTRVFASGPGCPLFHADIGRDEEEVQLVCPPVPASLGVTVKDTEGSPVALTALILSRDGVAIPREVLATHLSVFRLPGQTNGQGRIVAPALTPGAYNVYLADSTTPAYVGQGLPYGYVGSVNLEPLSTAELLVTVEPRR